MEEPTTSPPPSPRPRYRELHRSPLFAQNPNRSPSPNLPLPGRAPTTISPQIQRNPSLKPRNASGNVRHSANLRANARFKDANAAMMCGDIYRAIIIYTDIAAEVSRNHPIALLQRSLCYLVIDRPSLAVIDAYRALHLINKAIDMSADMSASAEALQPYNQIMSYGELTRTEENKRTLWAIAPTCTLATTGFLATPLADLKIVKFDVHKPATIRDNDYCIHSPMPFWPGGPHQYPIAYRDKFMKIVQPPLTQVLDAALKAKYRLALSLWKCGGGAIRSALDVIGNALVGFPASRKSDAAQFNKLEQTIYNYIHKRKALEQERGIAPMDGIAGLLRTRYTRIMRQIYPLDSQTIRGRDENRLTILRRELDEIGGKEFAILIRDRDHATPELGLVAVDGINGTKELFTEKRGFYVSTVATGQRFFYCDNCAAGMQVDVRTWMDATDGAFEAYEEPQVSAGQHRTDATGSTISDQAPQIYEDADVLINDRGPHTLATPPFSDDSVDKGLRSALKKDQDALNSHIISPTTSFLASLSKTPPRIPLSTISTGRHGPQSSPDAFASPLSPHKHRSPSADGANEPNFQFCPDCTDVTYCSTHCKTSAKVNYHYNLCQMGLDELVRDNTLPCLWRRGPNHDGAEGTQDRPGTVPLPQRQKCLQLLLLRAMAYSCDIPDDPLEQSWCLFLDGKMQDARIDPARWRWRGEWSDAPADLDALFPELLTPFVPAQATPEQHLDATRKDEADDDFTMPWSFDQNVVLPLHNLLQIGGDEQGQGPVAMRDFRAYDGWVLETILAKLERNMRITPHAREQKFMKSGRLREVRYGEAADLLRPGEDGDADGETARWRGENGCEAAEERVWVASLNPVASLIRVAASEDEANCCMWEAAGCAHVESGRGKGVHVFADPTSPHSYSTAPAPPPADFDADETLMDTSRLGIWNRRWMRRVAAAIASLHPRVNNRSLSRALEPEQQLVRTAKVTGPVRPTERRDSAAQMTTAAGAPGEYESGAGGRETTADDSDDEDKIWDMILPGAWDPTTARRSSRDYGLLADLEQAKQERWMEAHAGMRPDEDPLADDSADEVMEETIVALPAKAGRKGSRKKSRGGGRGGAGAAVQAVDGGATMPRRDSVQAAAGDELMLDSVPFDDDELMRDVGWDGHVVGATARR